MFYQLNSEISEIVIKDYEYDKFCKKFVELSDLVQQMKNFIGGNYKNYLVNVNVNNHKIGDKTCVDIRYHFDGDFYKDNIYCIWCKGPNRTVFPVNKQVFNGVPPNRFDQNFFLEKILHNTPSKEIDDQTFIKYTSQDPHRGVVCKTPGKRTFVRLMGTDYIEPKNYVKRSN
jgi:hypothetical protein